VSVKRSAIVLVLLLALAGFAHAQKRLVNTDRNGLALKGHDPVAFFTLGRPVAGLPQFESVYKGTRYRFASAEHKKLFDGDPAKYEPQFGGFCAYGVSKGYAVDVELDAFQIVDGRLLMQYDKGVRDKFNQDPQGNLRRADENWPKVVEKEGR
jgi:YHS domain-containing protein